MVKLCAAVIISALLSASAALPDTRPLVVWSSLDSHFPLAKSSSAKVAAFLDQTVYDDSVCRYDAVILVDQPGLHASDLRSLPATSSVYKMLSAAPSSLQLSHIKPRADNSFKHIADDISRRCGSHLLDFGAHTKGLGPSNTAEKKLVVTLHLPPVTSIDEGRASQMAESEGMLTQGLQTLTNTFPAHLVIYSDLGPSAQTGLAKSARQDTSPPSTLQASPSGGILKRYQIFSPGLILSFILAFFVLLPIVMVGISALAGIQSPVRLDGRVLAEYKQKKNQ